MTKKEAFRLGFVARLAERGVTPSQFEKRASGVFGEGVEAAGRVLSAMSPLALAAFIGVPAAAGILTGWGHAEMSDVTPEDIEREKMRDFVNTYRSEAQRIRRKLQRSKWRGPEKERQAETF